MAKIEVQGEGIFQIRRDLRHRTHGGVYTTEKGKNGYLQFNNVDSSYYRHDWLLGYNKDNEEVYLKLID